MLPGFTGAIHKWPRVVVGLPVSGGEGCEMPLELVALAALAGRTVVAAAATDVWEEAKRGFARLLGRGDQNRAKIAERRLDETREQLEGVPAPELDQARAQLAAAWQTRLVDLLEEHPDAAGDLQALVDHIQAELPAAASAAGHAVAAARDVNITASDGSVAAGTLHGNVTLNPTHPGPAKE